jgi:hypothetical protein
MKTRVVVLGADIDPALARDWGQILILAMSATIKI